MRDNNINSSADQAIDYTKEKGIGKEFHLCSLLRFALPSIIMMVFTSFYVITDGILIARFVNSNALAALNIISPAFALVMGVSVMLSSGSSAIIARYMGAENYDRAHRSFTLITLTIITMGLITTILSLLFCDRIIGLLGANQILLPYCRQYFIVILFFIPTFLLQMLFQTMFITNGTPTMGMVLTILAGIINVVADFIFIVPLDMGIAGAAWGSALGTLLPSVFGLIYFSGKHGSLHFKKPHLDWLMLLRSCVNGSSELVSNLSYGVITFLFNISMMRLIGADGVAAITVIQYAEFLMSSLFFGFAMGVSPIFGYNYGSGNRAQTKRIFKICLGAIALASLSIFFLAQGFGKYVVEIFAPSDTAVYALAAKGFTIFSFCFILMGANIFAFTLFTALSNGKIAAFISFFRTFIFISAAILILPTFMGVTGIWLAVPLGELLAFILSLFFIMKKRKLYGYL